MRCMYICYVSKTISPKVYKIERDFGECERNWEERKSCIPWIYECERIRSQSD